MLLCENNDFLWSFKADVLAKLLSALLLSQENVVTASCSVAKMMYLLLLQVAKIDYLLLHQDRPLWRLGKAWVQEANASIEHSCAKNA